MQRFPLPSHIVKFEQGDPSTIETEASVDEVKEVVSKLLKQNLD